MGGLVVLSANVVVTRRADIVAATRRAYGWFVVTGFSTAVALLSVFLALDRERAAIVDSIVATAPLFSLVLTVLALWEFERVTAGWQGARRWSWSARCPSSGCDGVGRGSRSNSGQATERF